jgi:hypothetical protein
LHAIGREFDSCILHTNVYDNNSLTLFGGIAQLAERALSMREVSSSILDASNFSDMANTSLASVA